MYLEAPNGSEMKVYPLKVSDNLPEFFKVLFYSFLALISLFLVILKTIDFKSMA